MDLTFDPLNTRQDVGVVIRNDDVLEPGQDFTSRLQLQTAERGVKIDPNVTTIVIVDDDSK